MENLPEFSLICFYQSTSKLETFLVCSTNLVTFSHFYDFGSLLIRVFFQVLQRNCDVVTSIISKILWDCSRFDPEPLAVSWWLRKLLLCNIIIRCARMRERIGRELREFPTSDMRSKAFTVDASTWNCFHPFIDGATWTFRSFFPLDIFLERAKCRRRVDVFWMWIYEILF